MDAMAEYMLQYVVQGIQSTFSIFSGCFYIWDGVSKSYLEKQYLDFDMVDV